MTAVVVEMMAVVGEDEEAAAAMVVVAEVAMAGAEVLQLKVQNLKLKATELTFLRSDTSPLDLCSPSRHSEPMNLINLSILGS